MADGTAGQVRYEGEAEGKAQELVSAADRQERLPGRLAAIDDLEFPQIAFEIEAAEALMVANRVAVDLG